MISSEAIFYSIVLGIVLPIHAVTTFYFFKRRDIQPIKARFPNLVIVQSSVFNIYLILLCVSRIVRPDWPCWMSLWSGQIGSIVLANTYLVRCWILYVNHHVTLHMGTLKGRLSTAATASTASSCSACTVIASDRSAPLCLRYPLLRSVPFMFQMCTIASVVMLVPTLIANITIPGTWPLDSSLCDRGWADKVLVGYAAVYFAIFIWFAYELRNVLDGFYLKAELKYLGFITISAIIPWYVFNNDDSLKVFNENTFSVTTISLLFVIEGCFICTTAMPLYRSIYRRPALSVTVEQIKNLPDLLQTHRGYKAFEEFLKMEFALENLSFWKDCNSFQTEFQRVSNDAYLTVLQQVQALQPFVRRIFEEYIDPGSAPYEVNLPGSCVSAITHKIDDLTEYLSSPLPAQQQLALDDAAAAAEQARLDSAEGEGDSDGYESVDQEEDDADDEHVDEAFKTSHLEESKSHSTEHVLVQISADASELIKDSWQSVDLKTESSSSSSSSLLSSALNSETSPASAEDQHLSTAAVSSSSSPVFSSTVPTSQPDITLPSLTSADTHHDQASSSSSSHVHVKIDILSSIAGDSSSDFQPLKEVASDSSASAAASSELLNNNDKSVTIHRQRSSTVALSNKSSSLTKSASTSRRKSTVKPDEQNLFTRVVPLDRKRSQTISSGVMQGTSRSPLFDVVGNAPLMSAAAAAAAASSAAESPSPNQMAAVAPMEMSPSLVSVSAAGMITSIVSSATRSLSNVPEIELSPASSSSPSAGSNASLSTSASETDGSPDSHNIKPSLRRSGSIFKRALIQRLAQIFPSPSAALDMQQHVFDEAFRVIMNLMINDSFKRFINSAIYERLHAELLREQILMSGDVAGSRPSVAGAACTPGAAS